MATIFVDSAAVGSNNGTSWANAYTTLAGAIAGVTEVSGDIFLLDDGHSETLGANFATNLTTVGAQRGMLIKSVDKANDLYSFGATIIPSTFAFNNIGTCMGIHFDNTGTAGGILLNTSSFHEFISCKFSKQAAQKLVMCNSTAVNAIFTDCEVAAGTSYTNVFSYSGNIKADIRRLTISGTKGANASLIAEDAASVYANFTISFSDLSAVDNLINTAATAGNSFLDITLNRCKLPASFEYDDGATYVARPGSTLRLIECEVGTVSAPVLRKELQQHTGYCKTNSAKYRTGGASDGTTPHSFEMVAAANRTTKQTSRACISFDFGAWVTGGAAKTFEIFVAHNAVGAGAAGVLNNDEFWIEAEMPSDAGSAVAVPYTATSRCALAGTAAALTTDAVSAWTGASIATHQKVSFTMTPTIAGRAIFRAFWAPQNASDLTVHLCPRASVT